MVNGGELIKVGQFAPDPDRHQSFEFFDQESGLGHQIEDLQFDPRQPDRQVGTLNTLFDDCPIIPPLSVSWGAGHIREAGYFVLVPDRSFLNFGNFISRVAVGSLAVRYK